ncbi:MAG: hypothetical protein WCB11_24185 [Terriglobales bacterium]
MNYDKVQEISAEMHTRLNEQTLVVTNLVRITLAETPQSEIDAYQGRNDRLHELSEELSKLDGRILRAYRFHSAWLIRIVPPHTDISSWLASQWRRGAAVAHAVRIAVTSARAIETDEIRAARAQRTREEGKEVRAIADKISNYACSVHRRYPSGEVVVGENDLAAQLRKRRDKVGRALNLLLGEQKVRKASLRGYWKLNV